MKTCDVCKDKRYATKVDAPNGSIDLCADHKEQFESALSLVDTLFRTTTRSKDGPTDDECRTWVDRMIPFTVTT